MKRGVVTHAERAERRAAIAEFCHEGGTLAQACLEFGVSPTLVKTACSLGDITPRTPRRPGIKKNTLRLVADLVKTSQSFAALARKFGVSRQAVQQQAQRCARAGLKVRARTP